MSLQCVCVRVCLLLWQSATFCNPVRPFCSSRSLPYFVDAFTYLAPIWKPLSLPHGPTRPSSTYINRRVRFSSFFKQGRAHTLHWSLVTHYTTTPGQASRRDDIHHGNGHTLTFSNKKATPMHTAVRVSTFQLFSRLSSFSLSGVRILL